MRSDDVDDGTTIAADGNIDDVIGDDDNKLAFVFVVEVDVDDVFVVDAATLVSESALTSRNNGGRLKISNICRLQSNQSKNKIFTLIVLLFDDTTRKHKLAFKEKTNIKHTNETKPHMVIEQVNLEQQSVE